MDHSDLVNLSRYPSQRPYSLDNNPPSPVTSASSDLDSDSSAPRGVYMFSTNVEREVPPYTEPLLPRPSDARRMPKRSSRTSKLQYYNNDHVIMEKRVVRALLLYAREARLRIQECEEKLQSMENTMASFQRSHEQQMIVLVKSLISLQQNSNDKAAEKTTLSSREPSNQANAKDTEEAVMQSNAVCQSDSYRLPDQQPPIEQEQVTLDVNHNFHEVSVANGKPLYAVVNKKRFSKPHEPEITKFAVLHPPPPPPLPISEDDSCSLAPPPKTSSLDLSFGDESSSFDDNLQSDHLHGEYSEVTSLNEVDFLSSPNKTSNGRLKYSSSLRDHKKFRPLPDRPEHSKSAKSLNMNRHFSSDSFTEIVRDERYGSGRYEEIRQDVDLTETVPTSSISTKTGQFLNRFKKKLKDTKRNLAKATSKESEFESVPWCRERVDVSLETGNINLVSYKVEGVDVLPIPDNKTPLLCDLDSMGDVASRFSSDTSNPHIYELSDSPYNTQTRPSFSIPHSSGNTNTNNKRSPSTSNTSLTPTHRHPLTSSNVTRSHDSSLRRSRSVDATLEYDDSVARGTFASVAPATSSKSLKIIESFSKDSIADTVSDFGYSKLFTVDI